MNFEMKWTETEQICEENKFLRTKMLNVIKAKNISIADYNFGGTVSV